MHEERDKEKQTQAPKKTNKETCIVHIIIFESEVYLKIN